MCLKTQETETLWRLEEPMGEGRSLKGSSAGSGCDVKWPSSLLTMMEEHKAPRQRRGWTFLKASLGSGWR